MEIAKWLAGSLSQGMVHVTGGEHMIRVAAGLALKNALVANDVAIKEEKARIWNQMDQKNKSELKVAMINNLDSNVGLHSAQVIAAMAVMDIPQGKGEEVVETLYQKIMDPNSTEQCKRSALTAIGDICEMVDFRFLSGYSNRILTAVIGMAQEGISEVVRKAAFQALFNSLLFIRENFERKQERDVIMYALFKGTQASEVSVQVISFQCINRVVEIYYVHMDEYMKQVLCQLTLMSMNQVEEVSLQAIEFWSSLCEKETDIVVAENEALELQVQPLLRCRHYAKQATNELVRALFLVLCKQEEDIDDDEWCPAMAASRCMCLLSECVGQLVLQSSLPLIEQNIQSQDWHKRDAAIMTFGCVLEGADQEKAGVLASSALEVLVQGIQDQSTTVKDTSAWTLGRLCEFAIKNMPVNQHVRIVEALVHGLQQSPRIASTCCWGLMNFAEQMAPFKQTEQTCGTSSVFPFVCLNLMNCALRKDNEHNLRTSCYTTLASWVQASAMDMIPHVREIATKTLESLKNLIIQPEEDLELISNLFQVLNSLIRRLEMDVRASPRDIVNLLSYSIQNTKQIALKEDILICLGSLSLVMQQQFQADLFVNFVSDCLRMDDSTLCICAVGVVSDFCKALGPMFLNYLEVFLSNLGLVLSNPKVHPSVKPVILTCFGDLALSMGKNMAPYLQAVMEVLVQASKASESVDLEYAEVLRESIIDTLSSFVHSFCSSDNSQMLMPWVQFIFAIMQQTVCDIPKITAISSTKPDRLFGNIAGLLGDLAMHLPIQVAFQQPWIISFLDNLAKSRTTSSDTRATANWAKRLINNI